MPHSHSSLSFSPLTTITPSAFRCGANKVSSTDHIQAHPDSRRLPPRQSWSTSLYGRSFRARSEAPLESYQCSCECCGLECPKTGFKPEGLFLTEAVDVTQTDGGIGVTDVFALSLNLARVPCRATMPFTAANPVTDGPDQRYQYTRW